MVDTGLTYYRGISVELSQGIAEFAGLVAGVIEALGGPDDFLLKENGEFILLESGDKIGLEG